MTRIIVTGADGQLARELARLSGSSECAECEFVFARRAELDITSRQSVSSFLDAHPTDVIVNCAAYTAVDRAESDATAALRVNSEGVANLACEAAERDVTLVHISTDYVFDGSARVPYTENDATSPLSVYGETKRQGEREMQASGCRGIIIRIGWLYSAEGHNFVRTIAAKAQTESELRVVADQWGTPTWAADLAAAILHIVPQLKGRDLRGEVFHYADEGETSWWELADTIVGMMRSECVVLPITTDEWPTAARRPEYAVLDKTKIKSWFGVDVPDWEVSLERCLRQMNVYRD
ncbi:MAG: dTDP-4-dehydrorhamnose reductase [Rikenellaceae bacterium]|nr:dTDP-4-dehydrorhamnose reductase [Rikenellaceae bacterium]